MSFTLEVSWWVLPAIVTILAGSWVAISTRDYSFLGDEVASMFLWLLALVVSLVAWLIWALAA